jgi:hypothetical protein
MTLARAYYVQSGTALSGTMPKEICALSLENLVADCDKVFCTCCTECKTSPPVLAPTPPVPAPTTTRPPSKTDNPLFQFLLEVSPDGGEALLDTTSPQYASFEWLLSENNSGISSEQRLLQRYALATLYFSTGGDDWTTAPLWLTNTDECEWFSSEEDDEICDANGNYVEIDLSGNNLQGTVPLELVLLSDTLGELRLIADVCAEIHVTQFALL